MNIDVIIPVFNSEKTIVKSIDSVLAQSISVNRIIIIDDCSTDDTKNIICRMQEINGVILYKRNKFNLGAGSSRNAGLELSKSRYVAFLDSDDLWSEGHLMELYRSLNENKWAIFAYSKYKYYLPESDKYSNCSKCKDRHNYKFQLRSTLICTPSVLIDKSRSGDFSFISRRTGQDYALWLDLLKRGDACGVNSCTVIVQKISDSLSKNKFQSLLDIYQIQRVQEEIDPFNVLLNSIMFLVNTIKKKISFWVLKK
jgi:teichuronic acid biosynthesis glycosyltransferase TuaG